MNVQYVASPWWLGGAVGPFKTFVYEEKVYGNNALQSHGLVMKIYTGEYVNSASAQVELYHLTCFPK